MRREWIVIAHEFAHVARVRTGGEADQTHTLGRFEGVFEILEISLESVPEHGGLGPCSI